ncbi:DUF1995 family protein [Acaryochloris sp. CCMEE 5410]|uniref:DUF1995 family protein n=1 Tax=Acaryochloris sp. CCMEE 5410 TaxID=310037 RepID=UPI0002483D6D|nr:DUF1995 family protein [Acaryochloris sp. CCMEE 5410]KAI9131242.1 DUF1995 family protein [Acaryochloris sp. CCMEE 5410]
MVFPDSLETSISQAVEATKAAIADHKTLLQVEIAIPELKPLPVAQQYLSQLPNLGENVKVFFSDTGAAALARHQWKDISYELRGIEELIDPVQPENDAFVFIAPTPVEVGKVEQICSQAGDRVCILLNPKLEDVSIVGIGMAGRTLRERFLNNIESCYSFLPLERGAVIRSYPSEWQIWWAEGEEDEHQILATEENRPSGERISQLLASLTATEEIRKPGLLDNMQQFWKALTQ